MKILFSPSESKSKSSPLSVDINKIFDTKSTKNKSYIVERYKDYLQHASIEELKKFFGIKDEKEVDELKQFDFSCGQIAALRYTGIAYKYLDFDSLDEKSQNVFLSSTIIFSNLFGAIFASDIIPYYKLKQAQSMGDLNIPQLYKNNETSLLDTYLKDELIFDLRANFYEKFYSCKFPCISFKFLKNSKNISHNAKLWRGLVARKLSQTNPKNMEEFNSIDFEMLKLLDIKIVKNTTFYTYETDA